MANYVPTTPTIETMRVGDTINYGGTSYLITALGSYVDDGGGRGHRTVTISAGTFTASTADTVLSEFYNDSPTTQRATWSQSADA